MNKNCRHIILIILLAFIVGRVSYAQVIDTACSGEPFVRYGVSNTLGSTYYWNLNGGTINTGVGTNEIRVDWQNVSGMKEIDVVEKNALGCFSDTLKAQVWLMPKPSLTVSGKLNICEGDSAIISANGATDLIWGTGEKSLSIKVKQPIGNYPNYVLGTSPCLSDTLYFTVKVRALPKVPDFTYSPLLPDVGEDVSFVFNDTLKTGESLSWLFDSGNPFNSSDVNPVIFFTDSGYKNVRLEASNSGCVSYMIKQIYVRNAEKVFVPEAFSPNNDGVNDVFILKGYGIKSSHMIIYNRWGEVVFESRDFNMGWDGKVDGEYVLDNVYLYDISATGLSGNTFHYTGTITIVR